MRLIDADEFEKDIYKCLMYGNTAFIDKYEVLHRLNNAPTIEAEPIRHGKWIENDNGTYSCSECKSWIPKEQHYYARYCLHCGAKLSNVVHKMDEVNE